MNGLSSDEVFIILLNFIVNRFKRLFFILLFLYCFMNFFILLCCKRLLDLYIGFLERLFIIFLYFCKEYWMFVSLFVIVIILFWVLIMFFKFLILFCKWDSCVWMVLNFVFKYLVILLKGLGVRNVVMIEVMLLKILNVGFKVERKDVKLLRFLFIWFIWILWVFVRVCRWCFIIVLNFLVRLLVMVEDVCIMLLVMLYIGGLKFCFFGVFVGLFVMIFFFFNRLVSVCG